MTDFRDNGTDKVRIDTPNGNETTYSALTQNGVIVLNTIYAGTGNFDNSNSDDTLIYLPQSSSPDIALIDFTLPEDNTIFDYLEIV